MLHFKTVEQYLNKQVDQHTNQKTYILVDCKKSSKNWQTLVERMIIAGIKLNYCSRKLNMIRSSSQNKVLNQ
jgi:hypothetical protein